VFDPECSSCVWNRFGRLPWFRVGIVNSGERTIEDAGVFLIEFGGFPMQLPSLLRWMDDQAEPGTTRPLHPTTHGTHRHVDLVNETGQTGWMHVSLARGHYPIFWWWRKCEYRIVLSVEGANAAPVGRVLTLSFDDAGCPLLRDDGPFKP
jgi:hypothetical protein